MATAISDRRHLPDYAQATASRIELLGFRWRFIEDAHLADTARRVQVRSIEALAPPGEVAKYTQDLKRGDVMPPIIVTRDGYLVDGNTRTEAARKAGWQYFPAFRLDENFEGAPDALMKRFITLGAASNLTHGRGMARKDVEQVIRAVATPGDLARDIAAKLHIPVSTVNSVQNITKAREKLDGIGVDTSDESRLTSSHMRLLGGRLNRYTDPVLREYVELVRDGQYSVKDMTELGQRIEAAGTEPAKLEVIRAERGSRRDVIRGQASKPSAPAKLRQSLGYLLGTESPGDLVELNQEMRATHRRVLYDARDMLDKIITEQEQLAAR